VRQLFSDTSSATKRLTWKANTCLVRHSGTVAAQKWTIEFHVSISSPTDRLDARRGISSKGEADGAMTCAMGWTLADSNIHYGWIQTARRVSSWWVGRHPRRWMEETEVDTSRESWPKLGTSISLEGHQSDLDNCIMSRAQLCFCRP
jgi:hypothetical protein